MDDELTISTPEQVAFHYETAGIGSRFVASLVDHLILGVVLFLISCAFYALAVPTALVGATAGEEGMVGFYVLIAVLILIYFLVFWGYFVLFEILWRGSTPGKRSQKLRVLRRDGQPIGAGEAITRNLVRLVDFLPGFYGVGLISMFIDPQARRLGDFAAGTIVVREREETRLQDVRVPEPVPPTYLPNPYAPGVQPVAAPMRYDPLPGISLQGVTHEDYRLIREMLERVSRGEIESERARELAYRLSHGIASRMGFDFREWEQRGWNPLVFLESVLAAREARG